MTATYLRPSRQPGLLVSIRSFVLSFFRQRGASTLPLAATSQSRPFSDREQDERARGVAGMVVHEASDGRDSMVFRKESRHDSFQRQISALRQQLSADQDDEVSDDAEEMPPLEFPSNAPAERAVEPLTLRPPSMQPAGSATGVIAAGSSWSGTLITAGSLHIFGIVEGEILADADVFVAEGADVNAQVTATNVIVAGSIGGTIECRARLEVWPTGHVTGEISSPSLVVHEGASMDGKVAMQTAGTQR